MLHITNLVTEEHVFHEVIFFIVSTWYIHCWMNKWRYIPSFFTPTEIIPMRFHYIFFQCAGSDEQLGKLVYNALETATGNFVLLYEWVLQWQKKMGPFLTSQEKEKIDKCKKQVGISGGPWAEASPWNEEVTEQKSGVFDWLAKMTEWPWDLFNQRGWWGTRPPSRVSSAPCWLWHNSHSVVTTSRLFSAPPLSASFMVLIAISKEKETRIYDRKTGRKYTEIIMVVFGWWPSR